MYYVYVIQSRIDRRLYVGLSQNPAKRLTEHNAGYVFSTKGYCPWQLVYEEVMGSRQEARKREKFLKGGSGKEFLKKYLQHKVDV